MKRTVRLAILFAFLAVGVFPEAGRAGESKPVSYGFLAEVASLKKRDAHEFLLQYAKRQDSLAIRRAVDKLVAEKAASWADCLFARVEEGERCLLSSAEELIFGTEGDPPEIPSEIDLGGKLIGKIKPTESTFVAFEVRNAGIHWEIQPQMEDSVVEGKRETKAVYLRSSGKFEITRLLAKDPVVEKTRLPENNPFAGKWQPRFHQVAIDHDLVIALDEPNLVGSFEEGAQPDRRLLIFITAWELGED